MINLKNVMFAKLFSVPPKPGAEVLVAVAPKAGVAELVLPNPKQSIKQNNYRILYIDILCMSVCLSQLVESLAASRYVHFCV